MKSPHKPMISYLSETLSFNVVKSGVKVTCPASDLLGSESVDIVVERHSLVNWITPFTTKENKVDPLARIV